MGVKRLIESLLVVLVLAIALPMPVIADTHGSGGLNFVDFGIEGSNPLVALFLNFIVLVIAVYLILKKPIGKQFKDRKETLEKAIKEAKETKALAEASLKEAQEKMDTIEKAVERMRDEIKSAGEKEAERIVAEATERSQRMLDDTKTLVGHEAHRIADAIKKEAVIAIVQTAEEIIREKIAQDDHDRLTSDYIKQIIETSTEANRPAE